MRDKLKILTGCAIWDIEDILASAEQQVLFSTGKCRINLKLRDGMLNEKQQISVTK